VTRSIARVLQMNAATLHVAATVLAAGCALAAAGCDGGVTGPASDNSAGSAGSAGLGGAGGSGGGTGPLPVTCTAPAPGAAPIRRLTRFEFNNTARDLLFDSSKPGDRLPPEVKGNGFSNDAASLTTSRSHVDAYREVAGTLARQVVADPAALAKLSACDVAAQSEDVCAKTFIADFGRKAFRRALTEAEGAAFYGVYQAGKEGTGHTDGLKAVIEMALQSPQFLYRIELGTSVAGQTVLRPTSVEMATRLSYLLWG
jgi:hypothetical protein